MSHKIHEEICQLEIERDIVIRTGGQTGHTQKVVIFSFISRKPLKNSDRLCSPVLKVGIC